MALPTNVVEKDHKLQKSANELMALRWHWTLDKANPERVAQREYARQVGVDQSTVNRDANAWADYLAAQSDAPKGITPGAPQTPQDFRQLRKLRSDRQEAAKAIAAATGDKVGNVAGNKAEEVDAVMGIAQNRAAEKGTTVEHEIQEAAEWRARARRADKKIRDDRKERHGLRYLSIEGKVARMIRIGGEILEATEGTLFDADERELLTESVGKLRALLNLLDLRIAGQVDVDWDAELTKITKE